MPRFLRFLVLLLFVGFFYSLVGMSIFPENSSIIGKTYFTNMGEPRANPLYLAQATPSAGASVRAPLLTPPLPGAQARRFGTSS